MEETYVWVTKHGVLIAVGNSIEDAIKTLREHHSYEYLAEIHGILSHGGYYSPPNAVIQGGESVLVKVGISTNITTIKNGLRSEL